MINTPSANIELEGSNQQESAHNFAILDPELQQAFIQGVNTLTGNHFSYNECSDQHTEPPYGTGRAFPPEHGFYRSVYTYLKEHNPNLLASSVHASDGVTNSQVAQYFREQANIRSTTHTGTMRASPVGGAAAPATIVEAQQNLSGLKKVLADAIVDQGAEDAILKEIGDVEARRMAMINSPTNYDDVRKNDIQDVLNLVPGEHSEFTERMLNYLLIGTLIQQGVIPYIGSDGQTHLDFTPSCGTALKATWQPTANNAEQYIPGDLLRGFMAYKSLGEAPNPSLDVIRSRLPQNAPFTRENILKSMIPNSQKSLALSAAENQNTVPISPEIVGQASLDTQAFQKAQTTDGLRMITDQTSRFEDLAKKGKLPSSQKDFADLLRNPISEAGKRFGGAGSFLMLLGLGIGAWKLGKKVAGKEAKWFGKILGFLAVLAGGSVLGNIAGNIIENSTLDRIDPNRVDKEKKKLRERFGKMPPVFETLFPAYFNLSDGFGADVNNIPFGQRVSAETFFTNGTPPSILTLHPNIIDLKTELILDGKKATPDMLASYKRLYRAVYFRTQRLKAERATTNTSGQNPDEVFEGSRLSIAGKTLQQFLAEFYAKSPNNGGVEREFDDIEGWDMSLIRMNNFGLKTIDETDQSTRKSVLENKFTSIPSPPGSLVTLPTPTLLVAPYDKQPKSIKVGSDTLQLPSWDPAEIGSTLPTYKQAKVGSEYLVEITNPNTNPPTKALCRLTSSPSASTQYAVVEIMMGDIVYEKR